jgi:hypothetical protein
MIAGEGLDPVAVILGPLAEDLLADHRNTQEVMEEIDHLLGPGQSGEVAVYDDAVEAVIYSGQERIHKRFICRGRVGHGSSQPENGRDCEDAEGQGRRNM